MKTFPRQILTVTALGAALCFGTDALAADPKPQQRPPGAGAGAAGASPRERMEKLAEDLQLSDNQKTAVRGIFEGQMEKMRDLREDKDLSPEQKMAKFRELREAMLKEIDGMLDKEQREKWTKLRETVLPGPGGRGPDGTPGGDRGEMLRRLGEELQLTDAQKEKLMPQLRDEGEKMRALWADTKLSREEKMAKFKELRELASAKTKAILTPEQQEKWEKIRANMAAGRGLPGGPGAPGGPAAAGRDFLQRMVDELGLSDAQREKMRPVMQEEFAKIRELREDNSVAREDKLVKFRAVNQATTAKMKEILSQEQLTKWEKLREEMFTRRRDAENN